MEQLVAKLETCRASDNGEVSVSPAERALCERLVRGTGAVTPEMFDAARSHRLHLLLAASLAPGECQAAEAAALSHALKVEAALDAWRDQEASDLLDALRAAGARALLIKGAALAHTLYPQPHLRPRADIDLLIPGDSRERVERVLEARGWSHPIETEAELATARGRATRP